MTASPRSPTLTCADASIPGTDRLPAIADRLRRAASRFGTPLMVTDVGALSAAADELATAFPDPIVSQFSVKANDVAAVVAEVYGLGLGANVVSSGEWAIARRAGVPKRADHVRGRG